MLEDKELFFVTKTCAYVLFIAAELSGKNCPQNNLNIHICMHTWWAPYRTSNHIHNTITIIFIDPK